MSWRSKGPPQSTGVGRDADSDGRGQLLAAAGWMAVTLFSISLMAIAGREAGRRFATVEIMLHRSWISLVIVTIVAAATTGFARLATQRLSLQVARNAAHFTAQFLWLWALTQIPLSEVFALEFTVPIWLALLAPLLIGERLTTSRMVSVVIGFIGALVVLRPSGAGISAGSAAALGSAVGYALSVIAIKRLTDTDSALTILFWMSLLQGLMALALSRGQVSLPASDGFMWIVAVAICGLGAHYAMARAFALADTLIVAPMDYFRLPLIAAVGAIVYGEKLDVMVLAGGAIIIVANLINLLFARTRSRK